MPRKPLAYVSARPLVTFFLAACGGDVNGNGEEVEPTTVDEQTEQGTATQDEQDCHRGAHGSTRGSPATSRPLTASSP